MQRPRFLPDNFTLALLATVTLASVWPAQGLTAQFFEGLTMPPLSSTRAITTDPGSLKV